MRIAKGKTAALLAKAQKRTFQKDPLIPLSIYASSPGAGGVVAVYMFPLPGVLSLGKIFVKTLTGAIEADFAVTLIGAGGSQNIPVVVKQGLNELPGALAVEANDVITVRFTSAAPIAVQDIIFSCIYSMSGWAGLTG